MGNCTKTIETASRSLIAIAIAFAIGLIIQLFNSHIYISFVTAIIILLFQMLFC